MDNVTAVILAGGSGSRMQLNTTKQKLLIDDVSVLYRTVKAFDTCDEIKSIVVVVRTDEIEFAKSETLDFKKVKKIVDKVDADDVTRYLNDLMDVIVSVNAFGRKFTLAFNLSPAFVQKAVEVIMAV